MQLNVRPYNNKEMLLFPACIGDYLSKDHLAWVIDEVVELLDLSCLYNKVSSIGNPPYHPSMMLKTIFYAYTQNTFSSRKIDQKLQTDVAYIFLSGMQKPDFRTISDFRKNNLEEISKLFVQIVRLCKELGLVELNHVSLDSTIIKANASKDRFYAQDRLDREEQKIKQKIDELLNNAQEIDDYEDHKFGEDKRGDELPKELRDQKKRLEKLKAAKEFLEKEHLDRINLTDNDTPLQKSHGQFLPGYRSQASVDDKEQIIVACDVSKSAADKTELIPMIEQTFENTELSDDASLIVTADSGYSSMQRLKNLKESKKNLDAYIPDAKYQAKQRNKQTDEDSPFHKKNFQYDQAKDIYICPNNKELRFVSKRTDERNGNVYSTYHCKDCKGCKYFGKCTKNPKGRVVKVYENEHLIYEMREKLNTENGKLIYGKRKTNIEPVFGNIKDNLGFKKFLLRGIDKVRIEFKLIAIAHNLLKITKFIRKQRLFTTEGRYLLPLPIG